MIIEDPLVGGLLVLRHVGTIAAAAVLLLLYAAVGGWILRRAFGWTADEPARWAVQSTVGLGTLALTFLTLSLVGLLGRHWVLLVTVVLLVAFRHELRREALVVIAAGRRAIGASVPQRLLLALTLVAGLAMLAIAVGPPSDWDALMYHLRVPRQLLEVGRLHVPVDNFHVALVNAAQFASLPLVALGLYAGPAVLQVGFVGVALVATYALARAAGLRADAGWVAVLAVLGSPIVVLVGVTARIDVTLVAAVVAAHVVALEVRHRDDDRLAPLLGVLLGIAVAIKPQAGAYAVALVPVLAWRRPGAWRRVATVTAVALLAFLPWAIKNQLLVGAVFYPLGAPAWFQPWLVELYGSRVIPAGVDTAILQVLPASRERFDVAALFLSPERLTIETEGRWYLPSLLFALLPMAAWQWRRRPVAVAVAGVGLAYVAFATLPFGGAINLRYLMPAMPALGVGVAAALEDVVLAWRGRRAWLLATCLAVVAVGGSLAALRSRLLRPPVLLQYALGRIPAREVFRAHADAPVRLLPAQVEAVDRFVPGEGVVLLVNESRGLAFTRPVLADVLLSNWSFVSQSPAASRCLRGTGITHVLVNRRSLQFYRDRGASDSVLRLPELEAFRSRCVRVVPFADGAAELWTLTP